MVESISVLSILCIRFTGGLSMTWSTWRSFQFYVLDSGEGPTRRCYT